MRTKMISRELKEETLKEYKELKTLMLEYQVKPIHEQLSAIYLWWLKKNDRLLEPFCETFKYTLNPFKSVIEKDLLNEGCYNKNLTEQCPFKDVNCFCNEKITILVNVIERNYLELSPKEIIEKFNDTINYIIQTIENIEVE